MPPREAGRRTWASVPESAEGERREAAGMRRMEARALRRAVRRVAAKGRWGAGTTVEAVRNR